MKILIVIADLGLGGAQQVVINLANELASNNHTIWLYDVFPNLRKKGMLNKLNKNVTLISPDYSDKSIYFREKLYNSFLFRTGINKNYLHEKRIKEHKHSLKKVLKFNKIDAVNSHVYWADEFVLKNLKALHKNWWITLHGSYSGFLNNGMTENIETIKKFFDKCTGYIYLAESELNNLKILSNWENPKREKIYNGIPIEINLIEENTSIDKNKTIKILIASRAIKEKGWEEAILAVKFLNETNLDVQLSLAGDGTDFFDSMKNKYGDLQFIHFLGFRTNIEELIQYSHLVLLPSYSDSEALPTFIIEAIKCNKPIIGTDVGEIKKMINGDFPCGILIPNDTEKLIENISKSILYYIENTGIYDEHKENCKKNISNFTIERMANDYLKLLGFNK